MRLNNSLQSLFASVCCNDTVKFIEITRHWATSSFIIKIANLIIKIVNNNNSSVRLQNICI